MAGFTAPLVCERVPVGLMILVAAMVPAPGESPGDWWANTGWEQARVEEARSRGSEPIDLENVEELFLHDLPPEVRAEAMRHGGPQSGTPFEKPWPLEKWPEVPTKFVLCR